jgi:hypothetical protein
MWRLVFISMLFSTAYAQSYTSEVWVLTGLKTELSKKIDVGVSFNQRYGTQGLETFFPEGMLRFKASKWFRPSVEYRFIAKKRLDGSYGTSQRINLNASFLYTKKRMDAGLRLRYQFGFNLFSTAYDSEFDVAFRVKPYFTYDVKDFILSPTVSTEFFYDPTHSASGQQIKKIRSHLGTTLDLNSPHEFSFGYYYDWNVNQWNPTNKHIFMLSYQYKLKIRNSKKGIR